jgi:SP family general alpha glucoside:H+ symporter-like MFS transporter
LSNGAQVGEILGLYAAGIVVDRIGYRKTILMALFSMICFIFIPFFAQSLPILLVGEVLQGIPWGVFQTMTTAYASEVAPVALRAYLTTYVNLCWVMGQFIAAGVLRSFLTKGGELQPRVAECLY